MADLIYVLCAATSMFCAFLLFRGWRASRQRLLFWSALCFSGFAVNNMLMVVDFMVVPTIDLSIFRHVTALSSLGVLLFGLVWETT
jgi:hypothetical protein